MLILHTPNLSDLRERQEKAREHFEATIERLFPGMTEWHWYRALEAVNGGHCQRNEDTSHDEALAASVEIREAHEAYMIALHAFYLLRDGPNGVLGGKGL